MRDVIKVTGKGDFSKTLNFLERYKKRRIYKILNEYGKIGLTRLRLATPVDTGTTVDSWDYVITETEEGYELAWTNSNVNRGISIVMLMRNGHATRNGGYVPPNDFVTPVMRPILQSIADDAWRDITENANK